MSDNDYELIEHPDSIDYKYYSEFNKFTVIKIVIYKGSKYLIKWYNPLIYKIYKFVYE